jgi:GntR family transcriptional repressor for pyruvate dehydrogenase complex
VADTVSLAEAIVRELRDEILGGQYRPGERLPSERDLAARIGANRGSIREALKKLEQQRLIEIRPGGGARVTPVQEASLDILEHLLVVDGTPDPVLTAQCLDVLELLLTGAVRFAVERGSDEELARARELLRNMSARATGEAFSRRSELAQLRPPPAQLAAISKMLEKALAERDAPAAQEATRQLVRANRERLLKAVEVERTGTQASTRG